jgi:cytoskeletal protein RodZ
MSPRLKALVAILVAAVLGLVVALAVISTDGDEDQPAATAETTPTTTVPTATPTTTAPTTTTVPTTTTPATTTTAPTTTTTTTAETTTAETTTETDASGGVSP